MIKLWFTVNFAEEKKKNAIRRINRMLRGEEGCVNTVTDTFDRTWMIPQ